MELKIFFYFCLNDSALDEMQLFAKTRRAEVFFYTGRSVNLIY